MESKDYQVLHYERIEDEGAGTLAMTAEVLEIVNGRPQKIFVVPVIGMDLAKNPVRSE